MANEEISRKMVMDLLKDDVQISPNDNTKIDYFRSHIQKAYLGYKKGNNPSKKSLEEFAKSIIYYHNHSIRKQNINFQKTYYQNPQYIETLIEEVQKSEIAKNDPLHTFTRDTFIDPTIMLFENIIDSRYKTIKADLSKDIKDSSGVIKQLIKRFFDELISGVMLLEHEWFNDAFILWRSLLETTTTLLLIHQNPKLSGKYLERKNLPLMRIKIVDASKQVIADKSKENSAQIKQNNIPWYIQERFGWASELIEKDKDYSLKVLLELVKLDEFSAHYSFASLFVHEYLITPSILAMELDFKDYLLTLFFKLYEKVREIFPNYFTTTDSNIKKLEERLRALVKTVNASFIDFSSRIQNS